MTIDSGSHINARPCWRAATMSLSTLIGTTVSSAKERAPPSIAAKGSLRSGSFSGFSVQVRETLLQVERRRHSFERQPELDHRKGDLRLNPDDHALGPAQAAHGGEDAQRADRIEVDHVHGGDTQDDAPQPEPAPLRYQRPPAFLQVA